MATTGDYFPFGGNPPAIDVLVKLPKLTRELRNDLVFHSSIPGILAALTAKALPMSNSLVITNATIIDVRNGNYFAIKRLR